ncbi:hypothetical protein EVAR_77730_1 [Eumeta japonica]|uniref:Uncharacterized protein n=1 Tax=Eumeta variegata TaxID=151549 RepID=A0A4C1TAQ9_EUMVA|nr:hypothetical protein EVAR_77730_1 [Eumeta japonica]
MKRNSHNPRDRYLDLCSVSKVEENCRATGTSVLRLGPGASFMTTYPIVDVLPFNNVNATVMRLVTFGLRFKCALVCSFSFFYELSSLFGGKILSAPLRRGGTSPGPTLSRGERAL